ncbi:hypothetical protein BDV30DRAFT_63673 [Aspergillus minisclerotigenes]|uniref:Secreted protein n=1 Tax=Aspergillus minisclerotigenes TaxID=656917 RepID=A0A5N6IIY6_9EURO|nr:hypothetical protein BDV30DRAFT_63673 [Aspergillus minisclerotigenes]
MRVVVLLLTCLSKKTIMALHSPWRSPGIYKLATLAKVVNSDLRRCDVYIGVSTSSKAHPRSTLRHYIYFCTGP